MGKGGAGALQVDRREESHCNSEAGGRRAARDVTEGKRESKPVPGRVCKGHAGSARRDESKQG